MPLFSVIKKNGEDERFEDYKFCRTREVFAIQLPIETIVAPVVKRDSTFDPQIDIVFGGNSGAKINKFLDL